MFGRSRAPNDGLAAPYGLHHETPEQTMARLNQAIGVVSESLKESLARLERSGAASTSTHVRPTSTPTAAPAVAPAPAPGRAHYPPPTAAPRALDPHALPDEAKLAWNVLLEGNLDWLTGRSTGKRRTPSARKASARSHAPLAVVVTCVDARVTPEFIFDVGVGQLVVVRSAGNVCDQLTLASAEFGLRRFGTPLVVVLAHSRCQASEMAVKAATLQDDAFAAGFGSITSSLRPAYDLVTETIHDQGHRPTPDEVACAQAQRVVHMLQRGHAIGSHVERGQVGVVAAYYSVKSGVVAQLAPGQVRPPLEAAH